MAEKLYKPLLIDSIKATANLPKQRFVDFNGAICTAGAKAYGICDVETDLGQFAPVGVLGIFLVESGGVVTKGAVTSDATGKAVNLTTTEAVNGYALDEASADGEIIRIIRGI
jgi:hypothetical protein